MRIRFLGLGVIMVLVLAAVSYAFTRAFFTDTASATGNTFTAAEDFGDTPPPPEEDQTPDLTGIANHLVISEVQIATSEATTSDFVELYNPTDNPVNLGDFKLVKKIQSGTQSNLRSFAATEIIPAHGFYLWASSEGGYSNQINADISTGENITTDNSVALLGPADVVIDAVAWGTGHTSPLIEGTATSNPPDSQSIERKALSTSTQGTMEGGGDTAKGNGFDAGSNSTDFILRTVSQSQNSGSGTEVP